MAEYSLLIRGGTLVDGTGAPPRAADIAVTEDRIVRVGSVEADATAATVIDAAGLHVAPGFVNMLSHAYVSLLQDGRGVSDLVQGVTTEVFSEEPPVGPFGPELRAQVDAGLKADGTDGLRLEWDNAGEYLDRLGASGTAMNAATFLNTWCLRDSAMGFEDRRATPGELADMERKVSEGMEAGAFGIGSALIYPPANFMSTDELVALCRVAAKAGGRYHSHVRSEGNRLLEGVEELLEIGRRAEIPVELHHVKIAGRDNWSKFDSLMEVLETARARQPVSANMYTFDAGGTGLFYSIPAHFHSGGLDELRRRLLDPAFRAEVRAEIESDEGDWENLYRMSGGAAGVLLLGTNAPAYSAFCGRTMASIASELQGDPLDVLMDIVAADPGRPDAAYFIISEENIRREIQVPWVSFGSDAAAISPVPPFTDQPTHPRTYANFSRVLQHYVGEERLLSLPEAVRRLSALPCETLGLSDRGLVQQGYLADLVVFDPTEVRAPATYAAPHQLSSGMSHVVVNGKLALTDGEPTGALPGRVLRRGGS